jgi:hypothetical protein
MSLCKSNCKAKNNDVHLNKAEIYFKKPIKLSQCHADVYGSGVRLRVCLTLTRGTQIFILIYELPQNSRHLNGDTKQVLH